MLSNFVSERICGIWEEATINTKYLPGIYLVVPRGSNQVCLATYKYDETIQLHIFETFSSIGIFDNIATEEYYWFRVEEIEYFSKIKHPKTV